MADITKKVNFGIASPYRYQTFSRADADAGDTILVKTSLGRPATHCTIEVTGGDARVKFNTYHTVAMRIPDREGLMYVSHLPYLVSGVQYKDSSAGFVDIEAGTIYEWDNNLPINDIEIVTVSGQFDMFVT